MRRILQKIRFGRIVFARALTILFRRNQGIKVLTLDYADSPIFENSFQPVRYHFRNALWYKFDGKSTLEKELVIFNLPNARQEFDLVVVGLFRSKTFRLKLVPTHRLDSSSFDTKLAGFDVAFVPMEMPRLPSEFEPKTPQFEILESTVEMNIPDISFQFTPYNQNELI